MSEQLNTWERMELIHNKNRPTVNDYIPMIFDEFYELHGDRCFGDDPAILGGIGKFSGIFCSSARLAALSSSSAVSTVPLAFMFIFTVCTFFCTFAAGAALPALLFSAAKQPPKIQAATPRHNAININLFIRHLR